jgi:molybdenum cofactor synthesis domain-containing protein
VKKVRVEDAIGMALGHDLTEIRAEKGLKHRAFRRGHIVRPEDVERLKDLGKFTVHVAGPDDTDVHEDDAALEVAPLVAGAGVVHDPEPSEGKIMFRADRDGLFQVDVGRLLAINLLGIPALPTIPDCFPVRRGDKVAAFRIVPLTCPREIIDQVLAQLATPLCQVTPYLVHTAAVLVTGSEVYEGRIEDGFVPRLKETLEPFKVTVTRHAIYPDDRALIAEAVRQAVAETDIVFVTGGTSVDPDDVTVAALRDAGLQDELKGMPLQPGNNFTVGYIGDKAVCAVPAATLFHRATALDLLLPRLLAGLRLTRQDVAAMGHGGLGLPGTDDCFPNSTFGRGGPS